MSLLWLMLHGTQQSRRSSGGLPKAGKKQAFNAASFHGSSSGGGVGGHLEVKMKFNLSPQVDVRRCRALRARRASGRPLRVDSLQRHHPQPKKWAGGPGSSHGSPPRPHGLGNCRSGIRGGLLQPLLPASADLVPALPVAAIAGGVHGCR